MSIGKRVAEAIQKYNDATAQKAYGKPGRGSYKQFVKDNLYLITKIGLGISIENIILKVPPEYLAKFPEMKADSDGSCRIEEILYHVVRCGLLHEAQLPPNLHFHFDTPGHGQFSVAPDKLQIPASLIMGLAIAVITCPANLDEQMDEGGYLTISSAVNAAYQRESGELMLHGYGIPFNHLWGKRDSLWKIYQGIDEIWK